MSYLVTVTNDVYADDFAATFRFFETLEEAQAYKNEVDDGDWFTNIDIYEVKRIT